MFLGHCYQIRFRRAFLLVLTIAWKLRPKAQELQCVVQGAQSVAAVVAYFQEHVDN
jgi:hypothetical protein